MRNFATAAALVASLVASVDASSCTQINGNYYCNQVEAITYVGLGKSGTYNRVSYMNPTSAVCNMTSYSYSGPNAPFDEEVGHLKHRAGWSQQD